MLKTVFSLGCESVVECYLYSILILFHTNFQVSKSKVACHLLATLAEDLITRLLPFSQTDSDTMSSIHPLLKGAYWTLAASGLAYVLLMLSSTNIDIQRK